jgi:NhaP-type Na+/H+ or K+/H+ antiporter
MFLTWTKATPVLQNYWDGLFVGYFAPVGVAAIYYSVETEEQLQSNDLNPFAICSFIVFTQVIIFSAATSSLSWIYSNKSCSTH